MEDGKKILNDYPEKVRTLSNLSRIITMVTKENPPTQKSVAKILNTSLATINKIKNKDFCILKNVLTSFYQEYVAQRGTFRRTVYETNLAGNMVKHGLVLVTSTKKVCLL